MWLKNNKMNKHNEMELSIVQNEAVAPSIPSVKLKGVGDGFLVTINPAIPEEEIYKELSDLFGRLKHLTVNAKVVIDIGNIEGYDALVNNIKLLLKSKFDVGSITRLNQKSSSNSVSGFDGQHNIENNIRANNNKGWINERSDALILTGRVRSGQKIDTKGHLVIAGNVNPGAELTAGGNIIVLGSLLAPVYAGYPDDDEAFVMALDFRPPNIQIGGVVSMEINSELSGKIVYATVKDNKIITEDYIKTQPFGKIPWPTIM
ncbi:MAG: septum site-determining protein MinC [Desulfamplus sp.]|nr:septum site-determining protein MinC [Desulfamplus sp.]